jgi:hypothetical protein
MANPKKGGQYAGMNKASMPADGDEPSLCSEFQPVQRGYDECVMAMGASVAGSSTVRFWKSFVPETFVSQYLWDGIRE